MCVKFALLTKKTKLRDKYTYTIENDIQNRQKAQLSWWIRATHILH